MEISLKINGKEFKLSSEQNAEIEKMVKNKVYPFERANIGEPYYFIDDQLRIYEGKECNEYSDQRHYIVGNYCTDIDIIETQASLMELYMQLWRYSMEHGGNEIDWRDGNPKYHIAIDATNGAVRISADYAHATLTCVYFKDKQTAINACNDVFIPWQMRYGDVARSLWGGADE